MQRLPRFKYLGPGSLDEALSLLKKHDGDIKILAGGTDLLPSMKQKLHRSMHVLDLKRIDGLREIKNGLEKETDIGALTPLAAIEESAEIKKKFPALAEAAGLVAAPQIKNMGTIGGNIALDTRCWYFNQSHFWRKSIEACLKTGGEVCHVVQSGKRCYASFVADTVPALLALNARVRIRDLEGERQCLLQQIYTQDGKAPHTLKAGQVITGVTLPPPENQSGSSYQKLRLREAISFPLAGAAAHVVLDGDRFREVKIVLGAAGSGPIEVTEAAALLKGAPITEDLIEEAASKARQAARPVPNMKLSPAYRRKMAGILAKRALREAIRRAKGLTDDQRGLIQ
ncbi:MAG: FAD binding domain-containing protein [Desulfobacterales bacterium]|nr:FAD binding domain-containing protein [Desulfobacterales bacterium]